MAKLIGWPFVVQAMETPNEPDLSLDGLEVREVMNPWLEYVLRWEMIPFEPMRTYGSLDPVNPLASIEEALRLAHDFDAKLSTPLSEKDRKERMRRLVSSLRRTTKRLL